MSKKIICFSFIFLLVISLMPVSQSLNINSQESKNGDGIVNRWSILVGATAPYTEENVLGLSKVFVNSGWNQNNIVTILLQDATRENILNAIDNIQSSVDSDDIMIFYYTGHGKKDGVLLLDEENDLTMTGQEIRDQFISFEAENLIFIFDTCYSGSMIPIFSSAFNNRHCVVFAATHQLGLAKYDENLEKGIFTHFLIKGLGRKLLDENKNNWISIEETFEYVGERVLAFTSGYFTSAKEYQTPQHYDSINDEQMDITKNGIKLKDLSNSLFSRLINFENIFNNFKKKFLEKKVRLLEIFE